MNPTIVSTQNQWTINCLKAKDYHTAVVSSSSALEYQGIIESTHQATVHPSTSSRSTPSPSFDQCILLAHTDDTNDHHKNRHHNDHNFIYDHGIPLPPTVTDPETITPILIFNAALVHQQLARHCINEELSIKYLRRAYQLYALAFDAQGLDENPMFQFAVINNAAVINRQLDNNIESWSTTTDYLLSLYMALMDRACTSMTSRVSGFLANALPPSPVAYAA